MAKIVCYCGRIIAAIVMISLMQTQGVAAMDAEKHANIEALLKAMGVPANL